MNLRWQPVVLATICACLGGCRMARVTNPAPGVMADVGRRMDLNRKRLRDSKHFRQS